jgi:hypothetical protein
MEVRDRIRELRRVKAKELVLNSKNWRVHPAAQARALRAMLIDVGYADALIARELPDGRLKLIDGHLRAETTPDAIVPVLVLDVNEAEADKLLLTLDPPGRDGRGRYRTAQVVDRKRATGRRGRARVTEAHCRRSALGDALSRQDR